MSYSESMSTKKRESGMTRTNGREHEFPLRGSPANATITSSSYRCGPKEVESHLRVLESSVSALRNEWGRDDLEDLLWSETGYSNSLYSEPWPTV